MYGGLLFCLTFVVYNFQRLVKSRQPNQGTAQINWLHRHQAGVYLTNALAALAAPFFFFTVFEWSIGLIIAGSVGVLISLLYVLRLGTRNLRELPYLKIHLIAVVWVFACGFFPLLNEGHFHTDHVLFASNHYLFLLAITIPFDIRDLNMDSTDQRTIPQMIGSPAARILALALLVVFGALNVWLMPVLRTSISFWSVLAYTFILIAKTEQSRPFWYFGGLLDGSLVLLGISYLISC